MQLTVVIISCINTDFSFIEEVYVNKMQKNFCCLCTLYCCQRFIAYLYVLATYMLLHVILHYCGFSVPQ